MNLMCYFALHLFSFWVVMQILGHLSSSFLPLKYGFSLLLNVYSAKPSFFHDENRANLFEVEPDSGMLVNTDNGSLLPQASLNKSPCPEP